MKNVAPTYGSAIQLIHDGELCYLGRLLFARHLMPYQKAILNMTQLRHTFRTERELLETVHITHYGILLRRDVETARLKATAEWVRNG